MQKMLDRTINKKKLYLTLQALGWGTFFIVYSSIAVAFTSFHWEIYAGYLNTIFFGILLTELYRRWVKKNKWIDLSLTSLTKNVLVVTLILTIIWLFIVLPINDTFFKIAQAEPHEISTLGAYLAVGFQFYLILNGWSLIYFVFQFFMNFKQSEIEKWKLQAAVKDAELIALKSQINPHFIFNSLNNIRALVVEDADKARDMITHLSDLLRYSIQFNNKAKVSIEAELEIVENYLNLESIQYEDRLTYSFDIHEDTLERKIPPMAIQILVENAIKHGIAELTKGGQIRISTNLINDSLVVEVKNSGQLQSKTSGTGIGVKNVSERLGLLFGQLSSFTLENTKDNMVSARFIVPINA